MSRTLSHLAELQPELFCELLVELGAGPFDCERRLGDRGHAARGNSGSRRDHPAHAVTHH